MSEDKVRVRLQYEVLCNGVISLIEDVLTKHGVATAFIYKDSSWRITVYALNGTTSADYDGRACNVRGAKAAIRRKLVSLGADLGVEVKS